VVPLVAVAFLLIVAYFFKPGTRVATGSNFRDQLKMESVNRKPHYYPHTSLEQ
jgi:hypothetical protein